MALPFIAVGLAGMYLYKRYKDSEYDDLQKEKDDLEEKYNNYESKENYKLDIESIPFIVASLYAIANIDGIIDEDEEAFIQYEIQKTLNDIEDEKFKNTIIKSLQKIKDEKLSIKLSDAIDYITHRNEDFIRRNFRDYNSIVGKLSLVDNKLDERERDLLKRFEIICDKGYKAKQEIIELENQDLLPNYYLSTSSDCKMPIPSTKIITQNNTEFINICDLKHDEYYVKHPMNPQILFDLQQLDKIDELQIAELNNLAIKLGAKKFLCSVELEQKETNDANKDFNSSFANNYTSFEAKFENSSNLEEYESKFKQFNWEAEGKYSGESSDKMISELLWLKNDIHARGMIESMTKNKLKSYDIEVSFQKFKEQNSNFNLSAHLSLLEKIKPALKTNIEKNIQKSLNHTLKISIEF